LFAAELAKARCLKNELAKCKFEYTNLEAMAIEAEQLHAGTLSTMEAMYMSRVSSFEDGLTSMVVASRTSF